MIYEPRRVSRHRRRPRYFLYVMVVLVVAGGYWFLAGPGRPAAVTPKPEASPAPASKTPAGQTTPAGPVEPPKDPEPQRAPPAQEPAAPKPEPVQEPVRAPTTEPSEKPKRPAAVTPAPQPQPVPEPPQAQPKPPLELLDWKFVSDQNSRFLEATVKDNANVNYQYVQAEVSLYDDVGRYLGTRVASTTTAGGWLPAGGTWRFRLLIMDARAVNCVFKISGH
ncbi:MAG: FxLYD domain-containing protein [Bacillota bacterium]|nr:FxLYD domain-containing protein [Bacillota bacterium]